MKLPKDVQGRFKGHPKGDANIACPMCGQGRIDHTIDEWIFCRNLQTANPR